jgi:predicted amidohydrolase
MYTTIKAAAISLKPRKWDKEYNADKLERLFRQAARRKPDLMVATEGILEGYVVIEAIQDPEKAAEMLEIAEPLDGPYITRFRKLARSLKTCLAFGFAERVDRGVYNAAIFIDAKGTIRGKHHKCRFAEGMHPSWNFNRPGKQLRAFDTPFGRAGFLICNDRWDPGIARAIVLDGAQYLMICSYGSKSKDQNDNVMARARENGVPIVEANVGMNLIVNKGERVAYTWGNDKITTAHIDIPASPSRTAARAAERAYIEHRGPHHARCYRTMIKDKERKRKRVSP